MAKNYGMGGLKKSTVSRQEIAIPSERYTYPAPWGIFFIKPEKEKRSVPNELLFWF